MRILKSYGKVNIGLWITGKRTDGYHDLFTFMHTIDLNDRIYIKKSYTSRVDTSLNDPSLVNENNLVYRAIKEFENLTGKKGNFSVFIEKNIPLGSGLGGGSSNAAAVLNFLNEHFGYPLSKEDMLGIAKKVGADVPFFLDGGFALAQGIGDILTPIDKRYNLEIFIVYPNIKSETKLIYSKVDSEILTQKEKLNIIFNLQKEYGLERLLEVAENSLGDIAKKIYPQIGEVIRFLEYQGYRAHVSGSGSSVYCFGKPSKSIVDGCKVRNWKLIKTKLI